MNKINLLVLSAVFVVGFGLVNATAQIYFDTSVSDLILEKGGFNGTITHSITADRTWTLPDETGTVEIVYPEPYAYALHLCDDSTNTWCVINGTTGLIEASGTNEAQLLQDAINDLELNPGPKKILIYDDDGDEIFVMNGGVYIDICGVSIEGVNQAQSGASPYNATNFWRNSGEYHFKINGTASTACEVSLKNLSINGGVAGESQIIIDGMSHAVWENIHIGGGVSDIGLNFNGATDNVQLNTFYDITFSGGHNIELLFNGSAGACVGACKNPVGNNDFVGLYIQNPEQNGTAIWFRNGTDNNRFVDTQIGTFNQGNTTALRFGVEGAFNDHIYGQKFSSSHWQIKDESPAPDTWFDINAEDQMNGDPSPAILVGFTIEGNCNGDMFNLREANSKLPQLIGFNDDRGGVCAGARYEGMYNNLLEIKGPNEEYSAITVGDEGTLIIPTTSDGVVDDTDCGDEDGGLCIDTTNNDLYLRSSGSWHSTKTKWHIAEGGANSYDTGDLNLTGTPHSLHNTNTCAVMGIKMLYNGIWNGFDFDTSTGSTTFNSWWRWNMQVDGVTQASTPYFTTANDTTTTSLTDMGITFNSGETLCVQLEGASSSGVLPYRGMSWSGLFD